MDGKRAAAATHPRPRGNDNLDKELLYELRYFRPPSPFLLLPQMPAPVVSGMAVFPDRLAKRISTDMQAYDGKYLVIVFHPAPFNPYCPHELNDFSGLAEEFAAQNCEVLFVTTEDHYAIAAWLGRKRAESGLQAVAYPIISDSSHVNSRAYGVLRASEGLVVRATFIVDPKRYIRHLWMNDSHLVRCAGETLRLVSAFRHTDQTGSLCPADWVPSVDENEEVERVFVKDLENMAMDEIGLEDERHLATWESKGRHRLAMAKMTSAGTAVSGAFAKRKSHTTSFLRPPASSEGHTPGPGAKKSAQLH